MYSIYSDHRALVFVTSRGECPSNARILSYEGIEMLIRFALNDFIGTKTGEDVYVVCDNAAEIFREFCRMIGVIKAGGGLVRTCVKNDFQYLYIFRNQMWDLPKGKREKGEQAEANALREVAEETGLQNLAVLRFLQSTYHFLNLRNGKPAIKQTDWFEMQVETPQTPTPQTEEGITQALWLTRGEVAARISHMYGSIARLSADYFHLSE